MQLSVLCCEEHVVADCIPNILLYQHMALRLILVVEYGPAICEMLASLCIVILLISCS